MAENNANKKPSASKTTKRVTANRFYAAGGTSKTASKTTKTSTAKRKSTPSSGNAIKTAAGSAAAALATVGAVKAIKKAGEKSIAVILICFILAVAIGAGACFFLGKNDKFEIAGADHVYLQIGETYADEGVEIREFGVNLSKMVITETDLDKDADGKFYADTAGDYYISYTIKSLKFGLVYPIQKIRLISVVGASEGGE